MTERVLWLLCYALSLFISAYATVSFRLSFNLFFFPVVLSVTSFFDVHRVVFI